MSDTGQIRSGSCTKGGNERLFGRASIGWRMSRCAGSSRGGWERASPKASFPPQWIVMLLRSRSRRSDFLHRKTLIRNGSTFLWSPLRMIVGRAKSWKNRKGMKGIHSGSGMSGYTEAPIVSGIPVIARVFGDHERPECAAYET